MKTSKYLEEGKSINYKTATNQDIKDFQEEMDDLEEWIERARQEGRDETALFNKKEDRYFGLEAFLSKIDDYRDEQIQNKKLTKARQSYRKTPRGQRKAIYLQQQQKAEKIVKKIENLINSSYADEGKYTSQSIMKNPMEILNTIKQIVGM